MPSRGEHPDPGLIAAHAEGRLPPPEAERLDEHLASCGECYETFTETLRFALEEDAPAVLPRRSLSAAAFIQRPAFRLAAVLAVAATFVVAFQQLWLARSRSGASAVAELARAMGTTRFIEPRLTGGFEHGRLVVFRSVEKPQGLDAHSPAVIAAVARIRERVKGDSSPEALRALAATYLVSGDVTKAVKSLESARAQDPKNASLQSDLAAAYMVRASRLDEPADIPKALEAAETAITLENAPPEAWFNRALALEQLHLVDSARKAWNDYLERDSTSPWADEARKRIEELPPAQQSTLEEDRARAAIAEGQAAIDRLADEAPRILRDYFDNVLLAEWAGAQLADQPSALVLRGQAQQLGEAVFRATGDALPRDTALALVSTASRDPPRTQALGFKAFLEAQRLNDLGRPSCDGFRESRRLLKEGGSPYAEWARERVVVTCLYPRKDPEVLEELARIERDASHKHYRRILGRALWMSALVHSDDGNYDGAIERYRLAQEVYRALQEPEDEGSVAVRLTYVLTSSGDSRAAWREGLRALALFGNFKNATRREGVLFHIADACWRDRLARSALRVLNELVDLTRKRDRRDVLAFALIHRGQVHHALGQQERAAADIAEARSVLGSAGDIAYGDNIEAMADAAEGRILELAEPERALAILQRSMPYFEKQLPSFVPAIRVDVARALRGRGRENEARVQLGAAIRQVESQAALGDARQQVAFFDYAASRPFDEMVALQLDSDDEPLGALQYVERSRGQQLRASLLARPRLGSRTTAAPHAPALLAPETLQSQIPEGIALVYFVVLPDRVAAWVLSREASKYLRLSVTPDELERFVLGYVSAVESEGPLPVLREQGAVLFDALVRPLLPALAGHESLVLIPDAVLQSLPFASLWNRESRHYLVEDYRLGQSPNGSVFLYATGTIASTQPARTPRLLAVGNPRLAPGSGLPRLPGSEAEAKDVARLYADSEVLLNGSATKRAFLEGLGQSDAVHFAGHSLQGDVPGSGRLLLAAERGVRSSDVVRADEIASRDLKRTRLVVLAGCRTATGERSRLEGVRGLARPFLAAGVPMVVASFWDVDDGASRTFFSKFHRQFLATGDAAASLRSAQLALLRGGDPVLAHPSKWAGFVSFGGLAPSETAVAHGHQPGM